MKIKIMSAVIIMILVCGEFTIAQDSWKENSYEDFVDGTFSDAGANMYISHNGNVQAVNRWDVNKDGAVDILCVNSHPLVEMLDMSIYWGNGKDFSIKNHSYVPANGPMWATADDLNDDGEMDLMVANYSNGTWTDMESFVYYGGLDKNAELADDEWGHYPFKERLLLPSSNAQKAVSGDFNNDGFKDIVIAFSGGFWEYRSSADAGTSPSRIYWGGKDDFNPELFTNIMTSGATDVATADLNNDNWLDLVFANGDGEYSFIYYGSENGFSTDDLVKLPTAKAHAVELGDVNNDGLVDIVFANQKGNDSYAYLNDNGTFNSNKSISFQTYTAKDVVVSDFNKDGHADVFFTNHAHSLTGNPNLANRLIDSYLYYGSENGFDIEHRQELPSIGAWGANSADLNNDGWIDLVISNFQEHYSYEVPSFIYWNSAGGFTRSMRTCLYEHGAQGNTIADFNGDGFKDILITSMMGNSRGGYDPSYLYYGQTDGGFDPEDRTEFTGREAYEQAFADLDDDGDVDVLMVNRGEVTRLTNEVWIYWNDNNEFDDWNKSGLVSQSGLGVRVADLDRNGYLDIIVSNGAPNAFGDNKPEAAFIYWGSKEGWPVSERTEIPISLSRSCGVADMNKDGHLDLVFGNQAKGELATIFYGKSTRVFDTSNSRQLAESQGTGNPGVADLNNDGLLDIAFAHSKNVKVYYQNISGSFVGPQVIDVQAKTMTVGDVNGDGWLDLVCPFYKGGGKRSAFSTILLGSEDGFDLSNKLELATDGGTGSLVCDFNSDGYQDVFFFCHRVDGSFDEINKYGDHHTNSILYWGSGEGYSETNVDQLPSVGAHYDMGVDVGDIEDRNNIYYYYSSHYNSRGSLPAAITWTAETPHSTIIKFQIRSAESREELNSAEWYGAEGAGTYFNETGQSIKNISGDWIQYRAVFDMKNGSNTPVLKSVEISFE